jgi:hypothetical protein
MCPLDVDQTERGPQRWNILAPRRRKIHRLIKDGTTYGTLDPHEVLFNDKTSWNAWSKLAVQTTPPQRAAAPRSLSRSQRRTSPLSKLESLPSELLASIIEDPTLAKSDIIALGLASETLWAHVLQHVEKECACAQAPMAGVEIACTGTYLRDLPVSFAQNELAKSTVEIWPGGYMCEARKINWAAAGSYDAVDETPEEVWRAAWKAYEGVSAIGPVRLARRMNVEFLARCFVLRGSSPDALWVLRNLTTREYVRCRPGEGPMEMRGCVDCSDGRVKVRVDDVLLLRICWTKLESWDDREELGIYRGPWAGHCFDIVPREQLGRGHGWRDCTDEVLKQARDVTEKMVLRGTASVLTHWSRKRKAKLYEA